MATPARWIYMYIDNLEVREEVDLNGAMIELSDLRLLLSNLLSFSVNRLIMSI